MSLYQVYRVCSLVGIMQTVAECGGVRCLVGLGQSDHPVMIHEAVVALTIMVTTLGEESLSVWIESEVIPLSLDVVRNKSMTVEIRANTLTLLWSVSQLGESNDICCCIFISFFSLVMSCTCGLVCLCPPTFMSVSLCLSACPFLASKFQAYTFLSTKV